MKPHLLMGMMAAIAAAPLPAQVSSGNYRVPYATGTQCTVLEDFNTNPLADEVILAGINGTPPYLVVAAAPGTVRAIQDANSTSGAATFNNYIWIQHGNGEWTGYFHLRQSSITGGGVNQANLKVGDTVTAGQFLGLEGNVGQTSGQQLTFVCGVPTDANAPITPATGALIGQRRDPAICGAPNARFNKNDPNNSIYYANPCAAPGFSRGFYRIPYVDGTSVTMSRDHLTHGPVPTRLDMVGAVASRTNRIVAAADGIIMAIVDNNTTSCPTCTSANNYVWIAHANGEWTKYTHFATGSVSNAPPAGAGLTNGQPVTAGTFLGLEDQIGAASGIHLHFEVAVPTNSVTPFQASGGFINGYNLIPLFCDIPGNIWWDGDTYTAGPCIPGGCTPTVNLTGKTERSTDAFVASDTIDSNNATYILDDYASVTLRAGNRIVLRPGFVAKRNSRLHAGIQPCEQAPSASFATLATLPLLSAAAIPGGSSTAPGDGVTAAPGCGCENDN